MIKEIVILSVLLGCAYVSQAQNPLMMMAMMGGKGGGGMGNMLMRLMNNPYTLCKETEGVKAIPCKGSNICQMMSIRQYGFPNLMKCSPVGLGCCIKDFMSLQLAKMMN